MYTLKSTLKRGMTLSAGLGLVVASFASTISPVFADALNPLTERSLTLSSSSPGWAYTDGSGNSTYAPPNSGANGQKTGNYFSFKVSTDTTAATGTNTPIKAMSFQYCTKSAGKCQAPGNAADNPTNPGTDDAAHSDLNVNYNTSAHTAGDGGVEAQEVGDVAADGAAGDLADVFDVNGVTNPKGVITAVPGYTNNNPKYQTGGGTGDAAEGAKDVKGTYLVVYRQPGETNWTQSTGWTVSTSNQEEATADTTGKQNTIILQKTAGQELKAGSEVKVFFFANNTNYITNPGEGAFFVKINTFKNFDALDDTPGSENTLKDNIDSGDVIDGGVTVANVMNQSIQITTKVLETMEFSVGTVDPATLDSTDGSTGVGSTYEKAMGITPVGDTHQTHAPCDLIAKGMTTTDPQNVLELGNQTAESSLETKYAYATHSYWRLSSNSSAGATVYYSGHTLSNTVGDEIAAIGTTAKQSAPGSEQFGLAIANISLSGGHDFDDASYGVDYTAPATYENAADNNITGVDDSTLTDLGATYDSGTSTWSYTNLNDSFHMPKLDPLTPEAAYAQGSGTLVNGGTALFAFDKMSDTVPAPIASESSEVVDCVTAKMRYIANIAATTPAGIYTTKINYIAAPQY